MLGTKAPLMVKTEKINTEKQLTNTNRQKLHRDIQ